MAARPTGSSAVIENHGPIQPATHQPSPGYIRLNPISQYISAAIEKSAMFLVSCIVTFLERTSPASSMAKPAAIQNTRKPPIRNSSVVKI